MSAKHTPGPWEARRFGPGPNAEWEVMGQRHEDYPGRPGSGLYSLTECTTEADARLMAAAPDLLDVVETFIAARNSGVLGPLPGGFDEALTRVQAKARGGALVRAENEP